mmetsp:Transcript_120862/g.341728  ORF Transcript_120862/g.341728 Transcript_120862/m.341728 type:complete len:420 (-) Transcript_120862:387-1646(-)
MPLRSCSSSLSRALVLFSRLSVTKRSCMHACGGCAVAKPHGAGDGAATRLGTSDGTPGVATNDEACASALSRALVPAFASAPDSTSSRTSARKDSSCSWRSLVIALKCAFRSAASLCNCLPRSSLAESSPASVVSFTRNRSTAAWLPLAATAESSASSSLISMALEACCLCSKASMPLRNSSCSAIACCSSKSSADKRPASASKSGGRCATPRAARAATSQAERSSATRARSLPSAASSSAQLSLSIAASTSFSSSLTSRLNCACSASPSSKASTCFEYHLEHCSSSAAACASRRCNSIVDSASWRSTTSERSMICSASPSCSSSCLNEPYSAPSLTETCAALLAAIASNAFKCAYAICWLACNAWFSWEPARIFATQPSSCSRPARVRLSTFAARAPRAAAISSRDSWSLAARILELV